VDLESRFDGHRRPFKSLASDLVTEGRGRVVSGSGVAAINMVPVAMFGTMHLAELACHQCEVGELDDLGVVAAVKRAHAEPKCRWRM
jgi:hypothetical protein